MTENYADRLKKLRKEYNLTQKEIAEKICITERNYRRYETGQIDPATKITMKLADLFNVSIDYLVGRSDKKEKL